MTNNDKRKIRVSRFTFISFTGVFSIDTVDAFLEKINNIPADHGIVMYLNSVGGDVCEGKRMLYMLNNFYRERLILVGYDQVDSIAFEVFYYFKGIKEFLDDSESVLHLYSVKMEDRALKEPDGYGKFRKRKLDLVNDWVVEYFKDFITEKETKRIKKGIEVYLDHVRVQQIVKKQMEIIDFEITCEPIEHEIVIS